MGIPEEYGEYDADWWDSEHNDWDYASILPVYSGEPEENESEYFIAMTSPQAIMDEQEEF